MQNSTADAVCYEVTIDVAREVADGFRIWLATHVEEMLSLPGFVSALSWEPDGATGADVRFVVAYVLRDRAALERYLEVDAPRMRGDGVDRFGPHMTASRRIGRVRDSC